ncbi:hypothetical protein E1B28_011895 [Marasmius oreades]|uniref:Ser-Thr-rich glycosyl-phosphatidyl-inositol-anchored membrane family-domain-containing protein n=1 Tax=Marasmius oreades TaxID=181124 RepID=A0A9P7RWH4_9AGAR|nr:uncharacterized protein E1B28_011895 [Marasmius oreades]KAG7090298.1 hypothetical protein E1B28_011895 [Marasmius oreades]
MQFKLSALLTFIAATAVNAAPAVHSRNVLDVWSPRIISPDATTVWVTGSIVNVTWDTSDAPVLISNGAGITLNKDDRIGSEGFLKEFNSFSLLDGFAEVSVPDVYPGHDYSITLFGDSGNNSPHFQISAA